MEFHHQQWDFSFSKCKTMGLTCSRSMLTEDEFTIKKGSQEKRVYDAWWFKSKPWMMDMDSVDMYIMGFTL